jgi:hypothetical protein
MDLIKYFAIYLDNSCEIHFKNDTKLILSPCGAEFMYYSYNNDLLENGSFKYRTAYALSKFSTQLSLILKYRNLYCNNRPFLSPTLLELQNDFWVCKSL